MARSGILLLFCFLAVPLSAQQKEVIHSGISNLAYQADFRVNDRSAYKVSLFDRRIIGSFRPSMKMISLGYERKMSHWKAGAGAGFYEFAFPIDKDVSVEYRQPEFRPYIYLLHPLVNKSVKVTLRYLVEERIRKNIGEGEEEIPGYHHYTRVRLKVGMTRSAGSVYGKSVGIYLSGEVLTQFGKDIYHFFDQGRLLAGTDVSISDGVRLSLGYEYWCMINTRSIRHLHFPSVTIYQVF